MKESASKKTKKRKQIAVHPQQTPQPVSPYRTAFRNSFSLVNLLVLALVFVYIYTVYAATPVYYAKLSDSFDRISFHPNLQTTLNDLTAVENVGLQKIALNDPPVTGLFFAPECQTGNMLFLQKGGRVVPNAPQCGCYIFMGIMSDGSLAPCKLKQIGDKYGITKDGLDGRFYSAGKIDGMQFIHTKIESYDLTDALSLVFSGKNIVVFDIFTFQIPALRCWKREPVVLDIQK